MTINSSLDLIKELSRKVLEERSIIKKLYSEKLTEEDISTDKANREEMLKNHYFIEAYTTEYMLINGVQRPNYTSISTNYYGACEISFDDIQEAVESGFFKVPHFYTAPAAKKLLGFFSLVSSSPFMNLFFKEKVGNKTGGDEDWANPDSEKVEFTIHPREDFEYMTWKAESDASNGYNPKNENIYIEGMEFLTPLIEVGRADNLSIKLPSYTPSGGTWQRAAGYGVIDTTTEESKDPEITDCATTNFSVNDKVFISVSKKRDDLKDKNSIVITSKCVSNGNISIKIRENPEVTISVTTSLKYPELVASKIVESSFGGYTAVCIGNVVTFTCTSAGEKTGAVVFNPGLTGVTADVLTGIASTLPSTLNKTIKQNRALVKILTVENTVDVAPAATTTSPTASEIIVQEPYSRSDRSRLINSDYN